MHEQQQRGSAGLAIKAGFWYVLSTFLVKALSFITTPIFSRLMNEADYGEFANFASWEVTLLIITGAELYNTVSRAYYDFKEDFDSYVSTVTVASCGITVVLYLVFLGGWDWISKVVAIPREYLHIMFFVLMFNACKQIFMTRERTLYRYKAVAAISVVNLLIPTLVAVALVVLSPLSARLGARIYGFYVPSALVGLVCALVVLKRGKSFKLKYCKYAFALSLPLLAHYLTAHLLTSSNTFVTKNVLGAAAVAMVSIASSSNHILTLLLQAVSGAVTTWLMDNLDAQKISVVRKGTLIYTAGIAAVAVGVMLLAPEIIWVLGGAKYKAAVWLMPGMAMSALVQSATTIFTIILTYNKSVVKTAAYTSAVAVLTVAAKFLLLPVLGVYSLPFINIAAFAVLFIINYILVRRAGYGKYINLKAMGAVLLLAAGAMAASYLLYKNTLLRYAVIAAIALAALAVAIKYKAEIMKFIKKKFKRKSKGKEA